MSVLVKMLDQKYLRELQKVFQQIDLDQTGMITNQELEDALQKHHQQLSSEEVKQIVKNVDYAGNGKINYSEFLAATIEIKQVLTYDRLWALFKYFDTDSSGYITPANIKEAFAKTGKKITDEDVKHILQSHDIEKNGILSFDEFRLILVSNEQPSVDFHQ